MSVTRLFKLALLFLCVTVSLAIFTPATPGQTQTQTQTPNQAQIYELASKLIGLKSTVLNKDEAPAGKTMVSDDILARARVANAAEAAALDKVANVADWEKFRDQRLAALKENIGLADWPRKAAALPAGVPEAPGKCQITGTLAGDGFTISNLVIAAQPGLPITANLYLPAQALDSMPGILIVTAHHNAKVQGELQLMGITWARNGCAVIIADNIGYGERRQQPYGGREDYRWRYYIGMELYTAGQDLMGWMVADEDRVLDVLAAQPGVDPKRLIVMGSVAGGGDIAAVLAALDHRVSCSIPFNYGQASVIKPATRPMFVSDDSSWNNFIGGGDYDAVDCLRNHGRDGFNNWLVAASAAPRYMIYAKEFNWTAAGDAGYARIAHIFAMFDAADHLDSMHGFTDCNNIGPAQRKAIYPILARWMNMPVPVEYQKHLDKELVCLTPQARAAWGIRPVHEVLVEAAARQVADARAALAALPQGQRREHLRLLWAQKLGNVTPAAAPEVKHAECVAGEGFVAQRILLAPEPTIRIPVLLLEPPVSQDPDAKPALRPPVVLCVAQQGKDAFVAKRALEVAQLLSRGIAVCVVDVRGVGETATDGEHVWYSQNIDNAARELALGQTLLGSQVRDLRSVLMHLRSRSEIDGRSVAIWGDSFAGVNSANFVDPPLHTEVSALVAEPMGATAAMLTALYEDDIKATVARGGLVSYASLLDGPACHVTLEVIVPRVLEAGDIGQLAASLAPLPLRLEDLVDGRNRRATQERLDRDFALTRAAYQSSAANFILAPAAQADVADWLGAILKK